MEKPRTYALSAKLLESYQNAALDNAQSLLEEAQILYSKDRFARAYFLAVSSIEETGKSWLAFSARGRNLDNAGVQKRLKEIFEQHSQKISSAFVGWLHTASFDKDSFERALTLMIHLERGREKAMYIDVRSDNSVSIPGTIVRPVAAKDCIAVATNCLEHMRRFVSTTDPSVANSYDDKLLCISSSKVVQIFKQEDFGRFLLDKLRREHNKFNMTEAIVTYHDGYFSRKRVYAPDDP